MSDKRFIIEVDENKDVRILDMELGGLDIGQYNVCKLLNNFYEENRDLQQELFDSERAYIHERYYHKSEIMEELEDLKIEFKKRFGRDFK